MEKNPKMREYCRREQQNRNNKWRRQDTKLGDQIPRFFPLGPHPWVNSDSELPSSCISSNCSRGCLLFTAVEVRVGVGRRLFSCRLSSWGEEMPSLCHLDEPAKQQMHILTTDQILPQTFLIFQDPPRNWSGKVKKGMKNLYDLIMRCLKNEQNPMY